MTILSSTLSGEQTTVKVWFDIVLVIFIQEHCKWRNIWFTGSAFTFNVIADSSIQFTDDYLMPGINYYEITRNALLITVPGRLVKHIPFANLADRSKALWR